MASSLFAELSSTYQLEPPTLDAFTELEILENLGIRTALHRPD